MLNSNFKHNKKSDSTKTTKGTKAPAVIASQSTETVDKSQKRKDQKKKRGVDAPKTGSSRRGATSNSAKAQRPTRIAHWADPAKRLTCRYPSNGEARERLTELTPLLVDLLSKQGLPIPPDEDLKNIVARSLEVMIITSGENERPEHKNRSSALLREFLILASAPE